MAKKEEKAVKEKKKENKVKKHFFKDFKAELKKVTWPTPKQLINNTVAVIVIVVIIGAIVFVLDAIFEAMNKYGITKLQNYVVEQFGEDEEENNDQENSDDASQSEDSNTDAENSSENGDSDGNTTTDNQDSTDSNQ